MAIERTFLGWNRACLPAVVDYLEARYRTDRQWNMQNVVVVTQGARAGRRLLELIAQRADDELAANCRLLVSPPRPITVGSLPELFYESPAPVASPIDMLLARLASLRASPAAVEDLVREPPPQDDLTGWRRLAEDFGQLQDEIEAGDVDCGDIAGIVMSRFGVDDRKRWDAIGALEEATRQALQGANLISRHQARCDALQGEIRSDRLIVLVGLVDLPQVARSFLLKADARIAALVWAPEDRADMFDDAGSAIVNRWQDVEIPLEGSVTMADRPADQAGRVVEIARSLGACAVDALNVALGDERLAPAVQRALELSGTPARRSTGRSGAASGAALLLQAVADYASDRTLASLAALLRQPDAGDLFRGTYGAEADGWIAAVDALRADFLPASIDCDWSGIARDAAQIERDESRPRAERRDAAKRGALATQTARAVAAADALAKPLRNKQMPLSEWSRTIVELLTCVYDERLFDGSDDDQACEMRALAALGECLERQEDASLAPAAGPMRASDAVAFTLDQLRKVPIAQPGEDAAVEITGWLDAALDDIPALVVAGVNEGFLPQSVGADPFLPNRMRAALGLLDDRGRYARDACLLCAMAHSRGGALHIVSGRLSQDGDPLRPSRLLFACDDARMIERATAYYGAGQAGARRRSGGELADRIARIPLPLPLDKPVSVVPVTGFADYLACPYRFYLKHVVRLNAPDDDCDEMQGNLFGTMAHDALRRFGAGPAKDSGSAPEIADALRSALEEAAAERFGLRRLPAVDIQLRQLGRRLTRFASLQAEMIRDGWRILAVERELEATFMIDGEPMRITGKIDRIDYNEGLQKHRLLDFKTSDTAKSPEAAHRAGRDNEKRWISLQLPLYRTLAARIDIPPGSVELGYVQLPKRLSEIQYAIAPWDEAVLNDAETEARRLLSSIRAQTFWPPAATPPGYRDGMEIICMDLCPDRAEIIGRSSDTMADWRAAAGKGTR